MTDKEILLTPEQVAERLQLSPGHVRRLAAEQHRIPFVRINSSIRFRPADIEAWLEARTVKAVK